MRTDFSALLAELEHLVQGGHALAAAERLRRLVPKEVPRRHALAVASLARRSGLPQLGLRLLRPVVRPPTERWGGSDRERTLYAACLVRIGAADEAIELLATVEQKAAPESLLYRAHGLLSRWDYEAAIPVLHRYLDAVKDDEMQTLVGRLNLAASLVHEGQFAAATPVLELLLEATKRLGLPHFHGNTLELCAQKSIGSRDWDAAGRYLDDAREALRKKGGLDELFVDKWRSILALQERGDAAARAAVSDVRRKAAALRHWETIRDCDLAIAIRTEDDAGLVHLYYGTPFEAFRRRIFREYHRPIAIPERYRWSPGRRGTSVIALSRPDELRESGLTTLGISLLSILSSDFYRPFRIALLHSRLYPGEYFNPDTSPGRVHQAVRVLRRWLAKRRLTLAHGGDGYAFAPTSSVDLELSSPSQASDPLRTLRDRLPAEFSSTEAAKVLRLSPRSTKRMLRDAVESELLERSGAGKATRYAFRRRPR